MLFRASTPSMHSLSLHIAFLPLAFILTVTAIKDGVEDYRYGSLGDQVNNCAAAKEVRVAGVQTSRFQPLAKQAWLM